MPPFATSRFHKLVAPAAVAVALVLPACGAGGEALEVRASSSSQVTAPLGSNLQDMRDLYELKREVAAFRRVSATSAPGC